MSKTTYTEILLSHWISRALCFENVENINNGQVSRKSAVKSTISAGETFPKILDYGVSVPLTKPSTSMILRKKSGNCYGERIVSVQTVTSI